VKYLTAGTCSTTIVLRVVVVRVTRRRVRVRRCAVAGMTVATKSARVVMKVMARRAVFVLMFKSLLHARLPFVFGKLLANVHRVLGNCNECATARRRDGLAKLSSITHVYKGFERVLISTARETRRPSALKRAYALHDIV
jgi:hypothetical protein